LVSSENCFLGRSENCCQGRFFASLKSIKLRCSKVGCRKWDESILTAEMADENLYHIVCIG